MRRDYRGASYLKGSVRALAVIFLAFLILFLGGCVSQSDFDSLKQRVSDLESRLQKVEGKLGQKLEKESQKALKSRLETLEKRIEALEKELAALKKKGTTTTKEEVAQGKPQMEEPPLDEEVQPEDIASLPEDQREVITELVERGIIKIGEDKRFYPNKPITAGELLQWIAKMRGYNLKDLEGKLQRSKLRIKANKELTREELITLLLVASDYRKDVKKLTPEKVKRIFSSDRSNLNWGQPLYPDYKEVSKWAARYVAFALQKGFYTKIFGVKRVFMEDEAKRPRLQPKKKVTRAEAALALKLILEGK